MTRVAPFLLCFLATFLSMSCASPRAPLISGDVAAQLDSRMAAGLNPGFVVGISEGGETQWHSTGFSRLPGGEPPTPDTWFEIGSITKAFTGLLLADMIVRGEVSLDDSVGGLLPPEAPTPAQQTAAITLRQLATHRAGLPSIPGNLSLRNTGDPYAAYGLPELWIALSRKPGPGGYDYSNFGAGLLGQLLAVRASRPYAELLQARLLDPLGLKDVAFDLGDSEATLMAVGHSGLESGKRWHFDALAPAGALLATPRALLRFAQLNAAGTSPLAEAMRLSHARLDEAGSPAMSVGMLWHRLETPRAAIVWHNGGTGGFRTFCGFVEGTDRCVVLLTNSDQGADEIAFHLLDPGLPLPEFSFVPVAEERLRLLEGKYPLSFLFSMDMRVTDGIPTVQATGQPRFILVPQSEDEYTIPSVGARLIFERNLDGRATAVTLRQNGKDQRAERKGD